MAKIKKKIMLIVEDDEVLLRALYLVFHDSNYTIATASDGDVGLKMAERIKPDIVILDLLLPKMNGFDFLKFLKADPKLKSVPVIVVSNLGDSESINRVMALGASDYFVKASTDLNELRGKVEKILSLN